MKQYIAMRATATSSVALRTDSATVQIGTDLMELVPRVATKVGNIVVVWDYTGYETMDLKKAVGWSEMILPTFVYALVDGDQFVLLPGDHRHHVND